MVKYDGSAFNDAERELAIEAREKFGLLTKLTRQADVVKEYPDEVPAPNVATGFPGTGRNDQCPCGSGRKYKKCCIP